LDDVLAAWINGEGSKVFNSDIIFSGSTVVSAASAEEIGEEG
jgi:hypothetical protein